MKNYTFRDIFWHIIPPTRVGVFSGRIKCPCEVEFWDMMERFFPSTSHLKGLDLGCGPGIKALTLALRGVDMQGFDIRESAIEHANENLRQIQTKYPERDVKATFLCRDLHTGIADIPTDSIDMILFVEVIEHLEHSETLLSEIWRVLRPGGRVVMTTPNKYVHQKEENEAVYGEKAYGHVREFDLAELETCLQEAGLQIEYQGYINPPAVKRFCRIIHPWMIRDHGFLQGMTHHSDVIGIRSLGFLQPVYNIGFPVISALIRGYNTAIFPLFRRFAGSGTGSPNGSSLFVSAVKPLNAASERS